jgi:hypothetical protein
MKWKFQQIEYSWRFNILFQKKLFKKNLKIFIISKNNIIRVKAAKEVR